MDKIMLGAAGIIATHLCVRGGVFGNKTLLMNTGDSLEPDKFRVNEGFYMSHYEASINNCPIYYGFSWRPIKVINKNK